MHFCDNSLEEGTLSANSTLNIYRSLYFTLGTVDLGTLNLPKKKGQTILNYLRRKCVIPLHLSQESSVKCATL